MEKLKRISQEKFDSLKKDEKDLLLTYYKTYEKENKLSKSLNKSRKKIKKVKDKLNKVQIEKKEILKKLSQSIKVYLQPLLSYVTKDGTHISASLKIVNHKNLYIWETTKV